MSNLAVVGVQWGDEGKGKVVDWLMDRADIAVRYQGGHNAGHTIVANGRTFKLNLLPSGVVRGKTAAIGPGVVIDPWQFAAELDRLRVAGVEVGARQLIVSDAACLVLPWHRDLDAAREEDSFCTSIGTTRSGIGPAYEDKVGRRAVRVADLADPEILRRRIEGLVAHHAPLRAGLGLPPPDSESLTEALTAIAPRVLDRAGPLWDYLHKARAEGRRILFEGAQGLMLDIDHGSYPYVTSSQTSPGQAAAGSGLGPEAVESVLGVVKAYTTRVGAGPFPTEQGNGIGAHLGGRGKEFGTVTRRKRRVGWFDAVAARQACVIGGVSKLALTKIDVLDGLETVRICTGYLLGGAPLNRFPAGQSDQSSLQPVYKEMAGWQGPIRSIRDWSDLPGSARAYVEAVSEAVGVPVVAVSTSPERDDMIVRADVYA